MNNEQKRKRITHWHSDMIQMEETLDKVNSAIGLVPEGDLYHACSCMMSALTLTTAELVGDEAECLEWYWLENEMGKRGFAAGPDGKERPIKALDDLFWLMEVNE